MSASANFTRFVLLDGSQLSGLLFSFTVSRGPRVLVHYFGIYYLEFTDYI